MNTSFQDKTSLLAVGFCLDFRKDHWASCRVMLSGSKRFLSESFFPFRPFFVVGLMKRGLILLAIVCWLTGCGSQTLSIRPILDEPDVFVGLVQGGVEKGNQPIQYDHPVEWGEQDLYAILGGLRLQEQGGILDAPRPKRSVFSSDDMRLLVPALRKAFLAASPSDRVVFAIWVSSTRSQALEVTSGSLFTSNGNLHIILANHRERVTSEAEGITAVRDNPMHILRRVRGALVFEPGTYMIDSQENWPGGGFDVPAVEVILDSRAFLASAGLSRPGPYAGRGRAELKPAPENSSEISENRDDRSLREEISRLKEELARIKRQLAIQSLESHSKESQ